ncbi:PHP domain-containing protein [Thermococcus sp.]|uniref:PHP domain-containing protein n=1 Tax=Thermococcus sp. TaxID=35749 RepID=UPI00260C576A|nr:PHP domain-containing protein [Thermococcus sp.]
MLEFPHDAHTHTVYSDGLGSIYDNIAAAEQRGLRVLGITDHSHYLLGGGFNRYVREIRRWGSEAELTVLAGVEANITWDGIDVPHWAVKKLDYVIASVHEWVSTPEEYLTLVRTALKDDVDVIGHFGASFNYTGYPPEGELREILELAEVRGIAFEISSRYRVPGLDFVRECIRRGIKLTFASDAHFPEAVGSVSWSERVFKKAGGNREDLLFGEFL